VVISITPACQGDSRRPPTARGLRPAAAGTKGPAPTCAPCCSAPRPPRGATEAVLYRRCSLRQSSPATCCWWRPANSFPSTARWREIRGTA